MFEIRPVWNFLENFVSCGLVSLNGAQRWTESGQEPGARGLERPADVLGDPHGDAAQDLGVQLVGAALDLALVLVEAGDDLVAVVDREAVLGRLSAKASYTPVSQSIRVP